MYQQIRYTSIRQLPKWLANSFDRVAKMLVSLLYLLGQWLWRGLVVLLGRPAAARPLVILTYHNVKADQRRRFARQMRLISRRYEAVAADGPSRGQSGRAAVAVTVDDGFADIIANVVPITEAHGIPLTVFIVAGYIGRTPGWIRDRAKANANDRLLSAEQIRLLASRPRCRIGSHTLTHPRLSRLEHQVLRQEVARSKELLEGIVGRPVTLLSFPYGQWNEAVEAICREEGYSRIFANFPLYSKPGEESFVRGRVSADPGDSWLEFRLKLAGAYQWCPAGIWLKQRLLELLGRGKRKPIVQSGGIG